MTIPALCHIRDLATAYTAICRFASGCAPGALPVDQRSVFITPGRLADHAHLFFFTCLKIPAAGSGKIGPKPTANAQKETYSFYNRHEWKIDQRYQCATPVFPAFRVAATLRPACRGPISIAQVIA